MASVLAVGTHGFMECVQDGAVTTVDGMILSGTRFILTGDLMVLGVMEAAGPTAVAGVTAVAGA